MTPGNRATLANAEPTSDDGLFDVAARPPLGRYLREVWGRREYLRRVPVDDLRAQNYDTVLGNLWHLLNPALLIGIYYLVFGVIIGTSRGVDHFIAFLAIGVFVYQFTQKSATRGAKAIVGNEGLIRSIRFPRAILPLSAVAAEALAHLPGMAIVFVVSLLSGVDLRLSWVLVPLTLVPLQMVMNVGIAFFTARASDLFRDFENILPFVFRLLFYMSGVIYSVEAEVDDARLRSIFAVNPIYAFAELHRSAVLGTPVNTALVLSAGAWALGLLVVGFVLFRAGEEQYGRG